MNSLTRVLPLALALLTGACMTSPPAPSEQYYRLSPSPAIASAVPGRTLHVGRFSAGGLLRERALVYSDDPGQRRLRQHAYHFWADAPANLMRAHWAQRLGASAGVRDNAELVLRARIVRMERLLGTDTPRIALTLELTLTDTASGRAAHSRHALVRPAASTEVVDSVQAFEAALDEIIDAFAAGFSAGADPLARNQAPR